MADYSPDNHRVIDPYTVDPNDHIAILNARESVIREQWIKAMELRLVQQKLERCYKTQGVNHYENCKRLTELYLGMLRENKVKGWRRLNFGSK